uniref:C2 domain-containing protein n=1 Tax=Eptatretus burgeri TaxID=7764 RepID=A0A8C4QH29_EPTBU
MGCLLGGVQEVIGRLEEPCEGLHDILCHIEAERPIIPEDVRRKLNPLLIHIIKARNLPNCPVAFKTLQEKCQPVYCEIQAPGFHLHRTRGHRHGEHIHFNDTCIFLLGTISHASLLQLLQGPPLKIFLHDRQTKPQRFPQGLGHVGDEAVVYRPSGVAHLDLSGLLSGQRCMQLNLPITTYKQSPDLDSGTLEPHFPPGHYVMSGAHLKVSVSTLLSHSALAYPNPLLSCPYRRVVFLAQAASKTWAPLHSTAVEMNKAALGLHGNADLGTYDQVENDKNLDILTGFHVSDKDNHILVLEGLYNGALQELCHNFQQAEDCSILSNWKLAFDHRLYSKLHLDFRPLHLLTPLRHLLTRPSLYIRSSNVPSLVRQALSRIDYLHRSWTLRSVIQNDLLPTADMILCLEQELDGLLGPISKPSRKVRISGVMGHKGTNTQNQARRGATFRKHAQTDGM